MCIGEISIMKKIQPIREMEDVCFGNFNRAVRVQGKSKFKNGIVLVQQP